LRITFDRGKFLAALRFSVSGVGNLEYVQGGLIDIQAGTSDNVGLVSEPFCFSESDPGLVALKE